MTGGPDVTALAINVAIPEGLRWTDTRRGEEFTLTTLNIRLLPDGRLAARAYGRPTAGGRGAYVSFPVPDQPELTALATRRLVRPARYGPPTVASAKSISSNGLFRSLRVGPVVRGDFLGADPAAVGGPLRPALG